MTCSPFSTNISAPGNFAPGELPGNRRGLPAIKPRSFAIPLFFPSPRLLVARIRSLPALGISRRINTVPPASSPRKIDCYEPDMGTFRSERSGKRRICCSLVLWRGVGKFLTPESIPSVAFVAVPRDTIARNSDSRIQRSAFLLFILKLLLKSFEFFK